jgi:hypothetical protein
MRRYPGDIENVVWIPYFDQRLRGDHDQVDHPSDDQPSHHDGYDSLQFPLSPPLLLLLAIDHVSVGVLEVGLYPGRSVLEA